jgi:hypothetical protein
MNVGMGLPPNSSSHGVWSCIPPCQSPATNTSNGSQPPPSRSVLSSPRSPLAVGAVSQPSGCPAQLNGEVHAGLEQLPRQQGLQVKRS